METDMSAKREHPISWRIFDAAVTYLQSRRLVKDDYGKDVCERKFNARDMYRCWDSAAFAGAVGSLYAGAGVVGASFYDVEPCVSALNALVARLTRGKCAVIGDYTDRQWVQRRHVIKLLLAARDQC